MIATTDGVSRGRVRELEAVLGRIDYRIREARRRHDLRAVAALRVLRSELVEGLHHKATS